MFIDRAQPNPIQAPSGRHDAGASGSPVHAAPPELGVAWNIADYQYGAPDGASFPSAPRARPLPSTGTVAIDGQTARFARPGLVEEYSVSMDGVRQDFIIEHPPLNPQLSTLRSLATEDGNGECRDGRRQRTRLARRARTRYVPGMSTQEILLEEIKRQPEPVLLEVWHYLKFLTRQREEEARADVLPSRQVEQEVLDHLDRK
jgi:hypothetical protein